jgi:hypothetical protein
VRVCRIRGHSGRACRAGLAHSGRDRRLPQSFARDVSAARAGAVPFRLGLKLPQFRHDRNQFNPRAIEKFRSGGLRVKRLRGCSTAGDRKLLSSALLSAVGSPLFSRANRQVFFSSTRTGIPARSSAVGLTVQSTLMVGRFRTPGGIGRKVVSFTSMVTGMPASISGVGGPPLFDDGCSDFMANPRPGRPGHGAGQFLPRRPLFQTSG